MFHSKKIVVLEELVKKENDTKRILIISIILILISALLILYREYKIRKLDKNRVELFSITNSGAKATDINAYINATYIEGPIASYKNKDKYGFYVIFDGNVQYLAYMKNSDVKKINRFLIDNPDKTKKIVGETKMLPSDIADYGKEFVKNWLDTNHHHEEIIENHSHDITDEEFYQYFGYIYLDTTISAFKTLTIVIYIFSLLGIMLFFDWIYNKLLLKIM